MNITTRSRTNLFLSFRESVPRRSARRFAVYDEPDDEEQQLIAPKHHLDAQLPPKWVDVSDEVERILGEMQGKMHVLEKLHAKHVLPGFADRTGEEREIEGVTSGITRDFQRCHALIQRIGLFHSQAAQNVQRGLAARVQDLSASFRKKQRVYMEKLQGHAIKNQDLLIASGTISLKGSEGLDAVNDDVAAAQSQSLALSQMDPNNVDLQLRDRELTEIAKSISSLAELFKDLSILVIDQGTILDSVEYNIEQTSVEMSQAVRELETAQSYQKNTGRRKIILLLILIIVGLIIFIIFKPRRPQSPEPPPPPIQSTSAPSTSLAMRASIPTSDWRYPPRFFPWEYRRTILDTLRT